MSYGIDTVKEYAECYVDEGTRDAWEAIDGALEQLLYQSSISAGVGWSLFDKVFTTEDVLNNVPDAYERIIDYVYGNLKDDIESYIEDHTYTINFLGINGEWETDEVYESTDEFIEAVNDYVKNYSFVIVDKFDPETDIEVTLREVEEDEED